MRLSSAVKLSSAMTLALLCAPSAALGPRLAGALDAQPRPAVDLGAQSRAAGEARAPGAPKPAAAKPTPPAQPRIQRSPEQDALVEELRELLDLDQAARALERGLAAVETPESALGKDAEAVALVARALARTGQGTRARVLLDPTRFPAAELGYCQIERASQALEADQLDAVFELLTNASGPEAQKVEVRFANFPQAWILLARAYARAGEAQKSAKLARRFVELAPLDPEVPVAWHLVASAADERAAAAPTPEARAAAAAEANEARQLHALSQRWHEVFRARRLQIRLKPDEPEPRFGLALCWMEIEQWPLARSVLDDLTRRSPDYCRAWFHLGECARRMQDTAAAQQAWTRALECDPKDAKSRFNRGLLAYLANRFEDAKSDFAQLLGTPAEADPQYAALFLYLARIALREGDSQLAEQQHARYRALGGQEALQPR